MPSIPVARVRWCVRRQVERSGNDKSQLGQVAHISDCHRFEQLASWTKFAGPEGECFAGTARYQTAFDAPDGAGRYRLDLGHVADSAAVQLNGEPIGTLIASPYHVDVDLREQNELAIEVTNVAANRIRDLDRRGVAWRIFKDINLVNIDYRPFDASEWPVRDAGLFGPVTLQRLQSSHQQETNAKHDDE